MKRSGTALSVLLCSLACWLGAVGSAKSDTADEQWCKTCWCCPMSCPEHAVAADANNEQEASLEDQAVAGTNGEEMCQTAAAADESTWVSEEASPETVDEYNYENWYGHDYNYDDVATAPSPEPVAAEIALGEEAAIETDAMAESEAITESEAAVEAEAIIEPEAMVESETIDEAEAAVAAEASIESETNVDTEAAIATDAIAAEMLDSSTELNEMADEEYFYENYDQGQDVVESEPVTEEAEYEHYTGYGYDEYWTTDEEAVSEPAEDESLVESAMDVAEEADLWYEEYESGCGESYREGYGYEYDLAAEDAAMPAETAEVESAEDGGFEYEYEAEYAYDGSEYWHVSEPVTTDADETTDWDTAADELEMLDDSELYGEESEYEACQSYEEAYECGSETAEDVTSWDNGSESWTDEESWESETEAVEEEMSETEAAEDFGSEEYDYEDDSEYSDAETVTSEALETEDSNEEYEWSSEEDSTEATEAEAEVSDSTNWTYDETWETADVDEAWDAEESETMIDAEEPIDPVLPDPPSAAIQLEQLPQQLLQAAAQAYQGMRGRVAGMADRLHFITVTELGTAAFSVSVDEVPR